MKIQLISDIHTEFHRDLGEEFVKNLPVTGDVLVIAGDYAPVRESTFKRVRHQLDAFAERYEHIIYVFGNHEYYGSSVQLTNHWGAKLSDTVKPGVCVVPYGVAEWCVNEQRFLMTPLFFQEEGTEYLQSYLNDYQAIYGYRGWVGKQNKEAIAWLTQRVLPDSIVITHHAPSYQSVGPKFAGSPTNVFFANKLDYLIEDRQPKVWAHGHMHNSVWYHIGETLVCASPFGYPNENPGQGYYEGLIIEA